MPWQHGASRTELAVSFSVRVLPLEVPPAVAVRCTVRGLCLAHGCRQNRVFPRDSLPPTGGEAGSGELG